MYAKTDRNKIKTGDILSNFLTKLLENKLQTIRKISTKEINVKCTVSICDYNSVICESSLLVPADYLLEQGPGVFS